MVGRRPEKKVPAFLSGYLFLCKNMFEIYENSLGSIYVYGIIEKIAKFCKFGIFIYLKLGVVYHQ
ncbi:hypothetical protein GCM10009865_10960 [Aeromicrobium ponti]